MDYNKLVKSLYSKKDKEHNFKHILKIKKYVSKLKNDLDVDENKLNFLIYFHGLKDYVKQNKNKLGIKESWVRALLRHTKEPKSIEEKLVYEANRLTNTGKEGLKKCIAYGKSIGRSKKESIKYFRNKIKK